MIKHIVTIYFVNGDRTVVDDVTTYTIKDQVLYLHYSGGFKIASMKNVNYVHFDKT